MKKKRAIQIAIRALLGFVIFMLFSGALILISIQGLANSDPRIAVVLGKPVTGTVKSKDRAYGYAVTIATNDYGDVQVACPVEKYTSLNIGDEITISYELTLAG